VALTLAGAAAARAVATPANATLMNTVQVRSGGVLDYEYQLGGPATHVKIRNNGDIFTVDDDSEILPGAGCWHPGADVTVVWCSGVGSEVSVVTGPGNDVIDVNPSGIYARITTDLVSQAGNDVIYGSNGNDEIRSLDGDDVVYGNGGDDIIFDGPGADRYYGGAGIDLVDFSGYPVGITADLDGAIGDDGLGETLGSDIENIIGTRYNDVLTGNGADNRLVGCGGSDVLNGLDGNDTLIGGADPFWSPCGLDGADVFNGGNGNDTVSYAGRTEQIIADLGGTPGNDGAFGEGDSIMGDVENLDGGQGNDLLVGGSGNNFINGWGGDDSILGLDGDDILWGGTGNDYIQGGDGADIIDGQDGTDYCSLGAGGAATYNCP
jgi:Ca2+-binding RTX toxin-like protein